MNIFDKCYAFTRAEEMQKLIDKEFERIEGEW